MQQFIKSVPILIWALCATIASAAEITLDDLTQIPKADVIILGEVHDNALHHQGQAKAIQAIQPSAVVFEMLTPEQAAKITPALLEDATALETTLNWQATGWPDFALYYPLFAALQGTNIKGAARPKSEVRRAFAEGAAAVFGEQSPRFGLTNPLPADQLITRINAQYDAHCAAMPREMMKGMVEAQRFRDAIFAETILAALKDHGAPVILITGTGHGRTDWGVPALLRLAEPNLRITSLAFLETPIDANPPFDLWLETKPAERPDPCLTFK